MPGFAIRRATATATSGEMSLGRAAKWLVLVAIVGFAGGVATVRPEIIANFYDDIYPSDAARRQALDRCFMQDNRFNRLDGAAREACYRRALLPPSADSVADAAPQAPAAAPLQPNAVDMRRAAAEGHLPRNDIRRHEQTVNALHLAQ